MIQCINQRLQCLFAKGWLKLAFPYDYSIPAHSFKSGKILFITLAVAINLRLPEIGVRLRDGIILTALMAMPEASVHKYASPITVQYQVRMSRQPVMMQPVPESVRVQILPDNHFRLGTLAADALHAMVPLGWGHTVRHGWVNTTTSIIEYNSFQRNTIK